MQKFHPMLSVAVIMLTLQTVSSMARADDATITITTPNPDGTQSFNSGDPIVFAGTCDSAIAPYYGIATLPWRTPPGTPLFLGVGKNPSWSSLEPGTSHSTISAPDVTSKKVYTLTAEFFDNTGTSIGSATVQITVNPKP